MIPSVKARLIRSVMQEGSTRKKTSLAGPTKSQRLSTLLLICLIVRFAASLQHGLDQL
jgi:hypothetical protein